MNEELMIIQPQHIEEDWGLGHAYGGGISTETI